MTKTYCVHIYPSVYQYENIKARTPSEAEGKALRAAAMDWDDIDRVEVMRQCTCGYDNDTSNKICDECGKKL